jgi:tetratricopeptide (TPR) repeat protein
MPKIIFVISFFFYAFSTVSLGQISEKRPLEILLQADSMLYVDASKSYQLLLKADSISGYNLKGESKLLYYKFLGRYLIFTGDYEQAISALENQVELARKLNINEEKVSGFINLGRAHTELADFAKAENAFNRGLLVAKDIKDLKGTALCLSGLGSVYYEMGNSNKAIDYYLESIEYIKQYGDLDFLAGNYSNLALVYYEIEDYLSAKDLNRTALTVLPDDDIYDLRKAFIYNNLGLALKKLDSINEAKDSFLTSLSLHRKVGNYNGEIELLNNLGLLALTENDFMAAITYYQKALLENEKLSKKYGKTVNLINLATVYLRIENFAEAKKNAIEALALSDAFNFVYLQKEALQILIELEENSKSYFELSEYLKAYNTLNDSLLQVQRKEEIAKKEELKAYYESVIAEKESFFEQEVKKSWIYLLVSSGAAIIFIVLFFKTWRTKGKEHSL